MRVCIHRGTQEIGGTCIEIEAQGKRIVLDLGLPLDFDDRGEEKRESLLPFVQGFREDDADLLAVLISHPHPDHYGLSDLLPTGVPIGIGAAAQRIIQAASDFVPGRVSQFKNTIILRDRESLTIGPFVVTPFLVDHSAFDSYAFLLEACDRKLFYSADFRSHGRKSALFERFVKTPPIGVDMLLMEGSSIGRLDPDKQFPTESELETSLTKHFNETKGMVLMFASAQNIDRVVTIFRACKRTGRQLIIDGYASAILAATENSSIPQGSWKNVRMFLPEWERRLIKQKKLFHIIDPCKKNRIYPDHLALEASKSVLLFRPSMIKDLEETNCLEGASVVYSLWNGYLKTERFKPFVEWLKRTGISLTEIHTSGHASTQDLRKLSDALNPKILVPIHTFNRDKYPDLFPNVEIHDDGEWFDVGHSDCKEDMTTPIRYYFAYGSNMNPIRFKERIGQYISANKATLLGFTLTFNKLAKNKSGVGYANINPDQKSIVEGVLYELIDANQKDGDDGWVESKMVKMDTFEGCPEHYSRKSVHVITADGVKVKAWTYIANPFSIREGLSPESQYIHHLLNGREFLSSEYINRLRSTKRAELAYTFELVERDFDKSLNDRITWAFNVSKKLFETLKLLSSGNYPQPYFKESDLIKLCNSLVADQCDSDQYLAGSWAIFLDPNMPSDARVDFIYLPTYMAIGILTYAYKLIPEIEKVVPRFWIAMRLGYLFASLRGLQGHGIYDDIGEGEIHALGTIGILKMGGIFDFLAKHKSFSPELMRVIYENGHGFLFTKRLILPMRQDNLNSQENKSRQDGLSLEAVKELNELFSDKLEPNWPEDSDDGTPY
ncbi:MAG: gamma-glutamylcyclotransferase [Magnetococcus sp. YQC-5]